MSTFHTLPTRSALYGLQWLIRALKWRSNRSTHISDRCKELWGILTKNGCPYKLLKKVEKPIDNILRSERSTPPLIIYIIYIKGMKYMYQRGNWRQLEQQVLALFRGRGCCGRRQRQAVARPEQEITIWQSNIVH